MATSSAAITLNGPANLQTSALATPSASITLNAFGSFSDQGVATGSASATLNNTGSGPTIAQLTASGLASGSAQVAAQAFSHFQASGLASGFASFWHISQAPPGPAPLKVPDDLAPNLMAWVNLNGQILFLPIIQASPSDPFIIALFNGLRFRIPASACFDLVRPSSPINTSPTF